MFGAILKAANSSFQKGMTFCRSVYVKKVMKLLAFIFEQPSYIPLITSNILRLESFFFPFCPCTLKCDHTKLLATFRIILLVVSPGSPPPSELR